MLMLIPEQVAAAMLVGVSFRPATHAEVQRLAMQRKLFKLDGTAVVATRDGTFLETTATLEQLIEEGERQQRDLADWQAAALAEALPEIEAASLPQSEPEPPDTAETELPVPEPAPAKAEIVQLALTPPAAELEAPTEAEEALPLPVVAASVHSMIPGAQSTTPPTRKHPRQDQWVTAGAERRGRAVKHWSTRRK